MLNKNCLVLNILTRKHKNKGIYYVITEFKGQNMLYFARS